MNSGDGTVLWFALTVGALIAIGIGLDRWARYIDRRDKESWSEPGSFTSSSYLYQGEVCPEQEPTALEDTPVGAPSHGVDWLKEFSDEEIQAALEATKPKLFHKCACGQKTLVPSAFSAYRTESSTRAMCASPQRHGSCRKSLLATSCAQCAIIATSRRAAKPF